MSVWQFMAQVDGWSAAHDPDAEKKLTGKEADDLWDWLSSET